MSWKDLQEAIDAPTFDLQKVELKTEVMLPTATEIVAAGVPKTLSREQVQKFEQHLAMLPQVASETKHFFGEGTYTRVFYQPAGSVVVGKIHAQDHVFAVLAGKITALISEYEMVEAEAPYIIEARAGIKRIVIAHTDAVIANVHSNPTNERDITKLERRLIVPEDGSVIENAVDNG